MNNALEFADVATSSDDYATRFSGPTGAWMLDIQAKFILKQLSILRTGASVLEVGGGHGQLAAPLIDAGYQLTVASSDASCAHRIQGLLDANRIQFDVANLLDLPYPDNAFDAVISIRLLPHCDQWQALIRELCRVSRSCVIVDYPATQSVNAIAPMMFNAKQKVEKNTRTWRSFKHAEITDAFQQAGYLRSKTSKQFFLPMVVHRMLKQKMLSAAAESCLRLLGLTAMVGSPAIARFEPATPTSSNL